MKTLYLLGACALLTTLFSCTADEFDAATNKTEIQKDSISKMAEPGPDDDPIIVPPPPKK